MSEPRPARDGERPLFGSVWMWDEHGGRYLALGLGEPSTANMVRLLCVPLHESVPRVYGGLNWGFVDPSGDIRPLKGWKCVQEAPSSLAAMGAASAAISVSLKAHTEALLAAAKAMKPR